MKMKPTLRVRVQRPAVKMPGEFARDGVRSICRLAKRGNPVALSLERHGATELAEAIVGIAEREPAKLKKLARSVRHMPSLLSCSASRNKEIAKLARRLELSADCPAGNRPDLRFDSLTTRFTVQLFEGFERQRRQVQFGADVYRRQRTRRKELRSCEPRLSSTSAL